MSGASTASIRAGATSWPSSSSSRAVASTAATHSGCDSAPSMRIVRKPIRSRPGSAPTSLANDRSGAGAVYGSPGPGPAVASSTAAVSRTLRVSTCSCVSGPQNSPKSGPSVVRARVGLRPTRPHALDGTRIEPPMSLPCATATMPAATAAAAPPLDPPGE